MISYRTLAIEPAWIGYVTYNVCRRFERNVDYLPEKTMEEPMLITQSIALFVLAGLFEIGGWYLIWSSL